MIDGVKNFMESINHEFDLKFFLDNVDIGGYIVDRDRKIIYWNHGAETLTGYSAEEVIGKRCADDILSHTDTFGVQICQTDLCPLFRSMKTKKASFVPFAVNTKTKKHKERVSMNVFSFPLYLGEQIEGGIEFFSPSDENDDLKRAMRIQKNLIPTHLPSCIDILFHPCSVLGGDLLFVNEHWLGIIDVSGHGISAALFSTTILVLLKEILTESIRIEQLGSAIEQRYNTFEETEMYFTAIFMKYTQTPLQIVSFGHPSPIIISKNGNALVSLPAHSPIGWGFNTQTQPYSLELKEAEQLLFYSDGLSEIKAESGILGEIGVMEGLKTDQSLQTIYIAKMERNIEAYQKDDISMIRYKNERAIVDSRKE